MLTALAATVPDSTLREQLSNLRSLLMLSTRDRELSFSSDHSGRAEADGAGAVEGRRVC
jgi:hypothetical protein